MLYPSLFTSLVRRSMGCYVGSLQTAGRMSTFTHSRHTTVDKKFGEHRHASRCRWDLSGLLALLCSPARSVIKPPTSVIKQSTRISVSPPPHPPPPELLPPLPVTRTGSVGHAEGVSCPWSTWATPTWGPQHAHRCGASGGYRCGASGRGDGSQSWQTSHPPQQISCIFRLNCLHYAHMEVEFC